MQDSTLSKLEASRKELLDLGLRNPLLNYRLPASRGLQIVQERSKDIHDILVKQGKAMTFLGKPAKQGQDQETAEDLPALTASALEEAYTDTKLQTNETEAMLQTRLLNTYYAARTSLEEQGINILYLSLGLLHWYETPTSEEARQAPLVLIPVSLERSSASERFRLRYTAGEVEMNLSLQAKLKNEFGVHLPDIPEPDDFSVDNYINDIAAAIKGLPNWKVELDAIAVGFFSFGKFMIYHDLDSNKWPVDNNPCEHPILHALFNSGFQDLPPTAAEDAFIDEDTKADELFQVVDADSSQLLAMLAVHEGRNLVIQGPPGTGKSQTITNLIANAIGEGKKVLFVAEKMAALEVVKRRLDNINLGEACLELHSHKANKKELHQELRRVLELGKPALAQLQEEVSLFDGYRKELNGYCHAVNEVIAKSGLSTQKVIGYLLQLKAVLGDVSLPRIPLPEIENWHALKMKRAEALAERIQSRLKEIGMPADLLFWGSRLKVMLPNEQEIVLPILQQAQSNTAALQQTSAEIANQVGLPAPAYRKESNQVAFLVELAAQQPGLKDVAIQSNSWRTQQEVIKTLLVHGKQLAQLRKAYETIFLDIAWEQPVLEIRTELLASGDKWYKFLIGAYNRSKKQLAALCKSPLPSENSEKLRYVDAILTAQQLEKVIREEESIAKELFGSNWKKLNSDWAALEAVAAYLETVHLSIQAGKCPKEILTYLERNEPAAVAAGYHTTLQNKLQAHASGIDQVLAKLHFDEVLRFTDQVVLRERAYEEQINLLNSWVQRFPEIQQAIGWNNLSETAEAEQLLVLIDTASHWPEAKELLKPALQKTWYEYLLEQSVNTQAALRQFERSTHEEAIQQFKKLDLVNLQYNRARTALKHWDGVPKMEAGGQVNVLRTEFNKKARHMPIRKLMQEAGLAIQAIKPVFMMSPLSIANFLPPGAIEFDLVIFDEASQVRPVDALGALLRGKQLVVVGDSKQLPPTSFFDSLIKDVDDEENVTADIQSILGMCDAQGAPQRMLRWHYRSKHESLISLSNYEFYENKLVIFPSPGSKERMGLLYHHLADTAYDRGKTRTNPKEAIAVVNAVLEHAKKNPQLSLGVVAFSTAQMQAIQDVLERERRKSPEIETFFKRHSQEPFFVKNLENVQGDERDVIFISVGYGRTEEGYVSMSFGPINNEGGERRLNVLITRAKLRCEVFTNLSADDIDVNRTQSHGVKALKSFLYFAQHGRLGIPEETGKPADSPFEENVAAHLTRLGYIVRKQVGSNGFYLDLAIVDPANPGRYLLGIECDGASYHAARSTRDRDRLRQQMLESIGWKICRIWSTDWFRNPERELSRLVGVIEKAKEMTALDDAIPEEELPIDTGIIREEKEIIVDDIPLYELATLPADIAQQEFHTHSVGRLSYWLESIVKVESPVHFDEAARRMIEAAGIARVGTRIKESIKMAVDFAATNGNIAVKGDFLWDGKMVIPVLRNRIHLPAPSRKLSYIAPEEVFLALEKIVRESIAIQPEAAVPFVAKLFGFSRVTEEMRTGIMELIKASIDKQIIYQDGEWLKNSIN
jgi:very-short-patch-repair endonuclease/DNA polymerase III delta prime subunit